MDCWLSAVSYQLQASGFGFGFKSPSRRRFCWPFGLGNVSLSETNDRLDCQPTETGAPG